MENIIIKIGVSSCLLGEPVRYNGGHKANQVVIDLLGDGFEVVPTCPEVAVGMGIPREPVQLVASNVRMVGLNPNHNLPLGISKFPVVVRMMGVESGRDWTEAMADFNSSKLKELTEQNLSGFIFKCRSPSCAIGGVHLHHEHSEEKSLTSGLFAQAFMKHFPLIPVIDEEQLQEKKLREDFIARVIENRRVADGNQK
ncbi:MAG: DUF523 domain-containing protein [Nitrospinaceae bacterium]